MINLFPRHLVRLDISENPFHELAHRTSGPKGKVLRNSLPFYHATATGLPAGIGSIAIMSDLQGRETGPDNRLVGEAVADELALLQELGEIPEIGLAILAGDLYDYPDCHKRGGTGSVDSVWHSFASVVPHVIGVNGNHDIVEDPENFPRNARILDGGIVQVGGITIGGVGGIIGNPNRNERKSEEQFRQTLEQVMVKRPDLMVLHQGPDGNEPGLPGDPMVRLSLETGYQGLTIFGHCRWESPFLVTIGNGQAVNVDGRVLVISG